ncbi:hypothetical protein [Pelagibius sp. Alg239-R121]|uniref:hypothetical protein n=1 Tax=Pelagibius sp. Alg239-R121 TaxID=2993448 RepID=UPI0024A63280|nr:hypothetical protein [Pelagibius sp. Alg239-R121]
MTTFGIRAAGSGGASSVFSIGRLFAVLMAALFISGCAQTRSQLTTEGAPVVGSAPKVLMMKADVEISVLTAAGLEEPNAEWTEQAKSHLDGSLSEVLGGKSVTMIPYEPVGGVGPESLNEAQILKLHEAVGASVLLHKYVPGLALPTKQNRFDWTMGEAIAPLRAKYDADYVMFLFLRDSFSSAGRVAANVVFVLLGAGAHGGQQVGYASLVDMKTGNVVWFNFLHSTTGDLRKEEGSRLAIRNLLDEAPL